MSGSLRKTENLLFFYILLIKKIIIKGLHTGLRLTSSIENSHRKSVYRKSLHSPYEDKLWTYTKNIFYAVA